MEETTTTKKTVPTWAWLVILIQLIIILLLLAGFFKPKTITVDKEVVKTITKTDTVEKELIKTIVQHDTLYIKEIEEVESNFNAVQFAVGKYELPEEAKYILYDLFKLMNKNTDIKLKVVGHTSDEGSISSNQKLSENRAKSVVDFLIKRGVDAQRLSFEGKGSSMPIDANKRELNRRTEFIIE
jgi:outer membrane protein OmpA-like peptidoglycan-associated protein